MAAVFAQGPIGLCATAGAKLSGATTIITVDGVLERLAMSRSLGAGYAVNFHETDPVAEIMRLTDGRGVDVAIEALGDRSTFESALRVLRPGGTLSVLGSTRPISPYRWVPSAPVFPIFRSSQPFVLEARSACGALCRRSPRDVSTYDRSLRIGSSSIRSSKLMSCSAISGMAC